MMKYLYTFLLSIFITGCGTTSFNITSSPDKASVYVKGLKEGNRVLIGTTPMEFKAGEVEEKYKLNFKGPIIIDVEKVGHVNASVLISDLAVSDIDLKVKLDSISQVIQNESIDNIVLELFKIQQNIKTKNFSESLSQIKKLKETYPHLSTLYEFEGGVYFLKKDFSSSYKSYLLAIKYNSNNSEALRMKKHIENNNIKKK